MPFVPLHALFGGIPGSGALVSPDEWALGAAIFLGAGWVLSLPPLPAGAIDRIGWAARRLAPWTRLACSSALAVLLVVVSRLVFEHRPLLVDSVVQLFQARIFASGRLAAPAPRLPAFFMTQQMLFDGGRWYSQYPPGHPAVLTLGVLSGHAWAVPVALTVGTALALYAFARRAYGDTVARLTMLLALLSPFFWVMGASYMSHVSALFCVSVFLWLSAAWEESGGVGRLALAAAVLGVGFLSRPYTVAAIGLPFALFGRASARRTGRLGHLAVAAVAFLVVAAAYPVYNRLTTGSALLPGYLKLWGSNHGIGFHATPWGGGHTPVRGLRNELTDLQLLDLNLFEWPLPALWPVGAALAAGWLEERWDRRLVIGFLAIPIAYFFYWHRDAYLGPRFLYSGLAFLLPLTARVLVVAAGRLGSIRVGLGDLLRPVSLRRWAFTTLGLCMVWGAVVGVPGRLRVYTTGRMASMRGDLPARAREAGIGRALVFVKVDAGNRLIARLRGMGASASVVEIAYRTVDFCELLKVAEAARRDGWSAARLDAELGVLTQKREILVRATELNGDPTLRLRRGRFGANPHLPADCAAEVEYDRSGYSLFTPHLLDDRPDLSGPLVVARDLRGLDSELEASYPDLRAYLYDRGRFKPLAFAGGTPEAEERPHAARESP